MKPFDLQKAINGHPLVTRDGREVTEFHYFSTYDGPFKCVAIVDGKLITYDQYGNYGLSGSAPLDLFLAPVKTQAWGNIYLNPDNGDYYVANKYPTESDAFESRDLSSNYIKTILLHEWEE